MRKAKILIVANSDFKSLFCPDVLMLAAIDLDLMQCVSINGDWDTTTNRNEPNHDRVLPA